MGIELKLTPEELEKVNNIIKSIMRYIEGHSDVVKCAVFIKFMHTYGMEANRLKEKFKQR